MIKTPGFAASLVALAFAAPSLAQDIVPPEPAPMTAQDLVTMPRLGAPTASPDGRWVVYTVTTTNPESYERTGKLYLRDLADPQAQAAELDLGGSASAAAFGADGGLYFLSDRSGSAQIWRTALSAGGAAGKPA